MTWFDSLPTEPGFYWWTTYHCQPFVIEIIRGVDGELMAAQTGLDLKERVSALAFAKNSLFAGPLTAPPVD